MRNSRNRSSNRRKLLVHSAAVRAVHCIEELETRVLLAGQPTMTFFTATPNPVTSGNYVALQATVLATNGGGMPTGTVSFMDDDTDTQVGTAQLLSGSAELTAVTTLPVGMDNIEADYLGNGTFATSSSGPTQIEVDGANAGTLTTTTTLKSSAATILSGQSVTLTATVPAGATGDVDFTSNGVPIGSATISGTTAILAISNLNLGTNTIVASYLGDSSYAESLSNSITETVNPSAGPTVVSTTTLTTSSALITTGQQVTFAATLSSADATGTVDFTSDGTDLSGPVTVANGMAIFSTSSLAVGTYDVVATYSGDDTYLGSASSPSLTETVDAATGATIPTATFLETSSPTINVGDTVIFTATLSDPGATGTVDFTSGNTDLSGPVDVSNGVATFSASSLAVGDYNVIATYSGDDTYLPSASDPAVAETVNPVPTIPTTTTLSTSSNSVNFGQQVIFTATVSDPAATGTVDFTSDGTDLSGPETVTAGIATFSTSSLAVGSYDVVATYSGDNTFITSASSPSLTETVNNVPQLSGQFTDTIPSTALPGDTISPALQITDAAGALDVVSGDETTDYYLSTTPDLTGIISPALASNEYTLNVPNGTSFTESQDVTIPLGTMTGTYYLVAQIDAAQAINANDTADFIASTPIWIDNSTALAFTTPQSGTAAGAAISQVQVAIQDQDGITQAGDDSAVTLSIASGPAGGAFTSTSILSASAVNGVATFSSLTLDIAGSYTLSASDATDGLSGFTSNSFSITPAASSKLVLTTPPVSGAAGVQPKVNVTVKDKYGNVVTTDTSSVKLALATKPTSATLGGTSTVVAVNGVAAFSTLSLTKIGTYSIIATDGTLTSVTSGSFSITPAAAAKIIFTKSPASTTAGSTLAAATATVEDQYGNIVTNASSTVTMSIATGPTGAALGGTITAVTASGVATFSKLSLTKAGSYTLLASDGNLSTAKSTSFTIAAGTASNLAFTVQPAAAKVAAKITPSVQVSITDKYGNVITTNTTSVTISISTGVSGAKLGGTLIEKAVKGIATFANLTLSKAGNYTFKAVDGKLVAVVSKSVTI